MGPCVAECRTSLTGNKVVSSLGPAREPVEPSAQGLGTPVGSGAFGVEAQRDLQPIGCELTGTWQGGVSVRSDQTRPPRACEERLTLLDREREDSE